MRRAGVLVALVALLAWAGSAFAFPPAGHVQVCSTQTGILPGSEGVDCPDGQFAVVHVYFVHNASQVRSVVEWPLSYLESSRSLGTVGNLLACPSTPASFWTGLKAAVSVSGCEVAFYAEDTGGPPPPDPSASSAYTGPSAAEFQAGVSLGFAGALLALFATGWHLGRGAT